MLVKLIKDPITLDKILSAIPNGVEWATSSQIADMKGLHSATYSGRIGFTLGYAGYRCVELKYKNRKVRAWYFGSRPIEEFTLAGVRHRLEFNDKRADALLCSRIAAAGLQVPL